MAQHRAPFFGTVLVLCLGLLLTQGIVVARQRAAQPVQVLPLDELLASASGPEAWSPEGPNPVHTAEALVEAVVQVESAGQPHLVGRAGERGLMQLKRGTWEDMTRLLFGQPLDFEQAFDPVLNRRVGRRYLAFLQRYLARYRSHWQSNERALLLAAYNAGPQALADADFDVQRLSPGAQDYVARVTALHELYLDQDAVTVRRLLSVGLPAVKQECLPDGGSP